MCTVLLPPGGNPIAVKYIIYHISYHIISYLIISYNIPFPHIPSRLMEQEFHTVHDPLLPHFNDFIICHQKQIGKCFWEDTAVSKAFSILKLFLISRTITYFNDFSNFKTVILISNMHYMLCMD